MIVPDREKKHINLDLEKKHKNKNPKKTKPIKNLIRIVYKYQNKIILKLKLKK